MKTNSLVILFLVIALLFAGCNRVNEPSDNSEQSSTPQMSTGSEQSSTPQMSADNEQSSTVQTSTEKPILIGWEDNYAAFLKDSQEKGSFNTFKDPDRSHVRVISLGFLNKDIDGDGVPELIVFQNGTVMTVYTFDGTVKEVGVLQFVTGTERFFHSNNPSYPGIFEFHLGGGLERYGYITIKDNQLIHEELWNEDYSGWRENRIEELSDDKALIRESKIVYVENNDIETTFIELIEN